jgi:hypothetical protein
VIKLRYILSFFVLLVCLSGYCQQKPKDILVKVDTTQTKINVLAPAKAAFYSAILPGLGQAYNKKYWKIPLVYGAIGAGIYSYLWNKNKYNIYRDAYKERLLLGERSTDQFNNDPSKGIFLSEARLIDAQKFHERFQDLSLLVTVLLYVLNIVDANVDGHLQQFNINGKLTAKPEIYQNPYDYKNNVGLALQYKF